MELQVNYNFHSFCQATDWINPHEEDADKGAGAVDIYRPSKMAGLLTGGIGVRHGTLASHQCFRELASCRPNISLYSLVSFLITDYDHASSKREHWSFCGLGGNRFCQTRRHQRKCKWSAWLTPWQRHDLFFSKKK